MIRANTMTQKQLRDYGFLMGSATVVIFGIYPWLVLKRSFVSWPWFVSLLFGLSAVLYPKALSPIYKVWMAIGQVLGKINSTLILGLCYLILFSPVAILFRIFKRDRLHRRNESCKNSFRSLRSETRNTKHMEMPF